MSFLILRKWCIPKVCDTHQTHNQNEMSKTSHDGFMYIYNTWVYVYESMFSELVTRYLPHIRPKLLFDRAAFLTLSKGIKR